MTEKTRIQILKASPLARELDDKECEALAELIAVHDLKDGEVLLREGQSDSNLYVIVSGVVSVAASDEEGNLRALHELTHGDLVGELSFMDNTPRSHSLVARGATRVFSLNREKFEGLIPFQPMLVYKVMRAIMRVAHAVQRRMSLNLVELQNYIYKIHGKY
ncbi:MAG TPA: cyclic nucleotide-binding domain-containing protein [Burkholderiales bacterium]